VLKSEEPKALYLKALKAHHDRLQAEQRSDRIETLESEFDQLAEATKNGPTQCKHAWVGGVLMLQDNNHLKASESVKVL